MTREQLAADLKITVVIAETIRDLTRESPLGGVPSGHLYTRLMSTGMTLDQYQTHIDRLKGIKMVSENNHLLSYVGPA